MSFSIEYPLCNPDITGSAETLVLRRPYIVDVTTGTAEKVETVVLEGGKITHLGKDTGVKGKAVEADGQYLLPGLWDMHIHTLSAASFAFPALLAHGVTGIRDLGSDLTNTLEWKLMPEEKPRIVYAGPIIDAAVAYPFARLTADTAEEARMHFRNLKRNGVGTIKVHNKTPREVYFALADLCRTEGIRLCGHIPFAVHALEAVSAGQVSIEHMQGIHVAVSKDRDTIQRAMEALPLGGLQALKLNTDAFNTLSTERFAEFVETVRTQGTFVTPTLCATESVGGKGVDLHSPIFEHYPQAIQKSLAAHLEMMRTDERMKPLGDLIGRVHESNKKLASMLHEAGVPFLSGTDSMFSHGLVETIVPFGAGLHDELALLVETGLSPLEAIWTATVNPAVCLGIEESFGTVEKGKAADLILVRENPILNIHTLREPEAVILGGVFHTRKELQATIADM